MAVDPLNELRDVSTFFGDPRMPRNIALTMGRATARLPRAGTGEDSPALSG